MFIDGRNGEGVAERPRRQRRPLTEREVVDRLEQLNDAICPPLEFWAVVLEILAPDEMAEPPVPASPTDAMPGTLEKLQVMAERVERGESPFHPGDLLWDCAESDRIFQVARNHGNGASARMGQPVLVQLPEGVRSRDGGGPGKLPPSLAPYAAAGCGPSPLGLGPGPRWVREGFFLPAESVLILGSVAPGRPTRRAKKTQAEAPFRQLLLFPEDDASFNCETSQLKHLSFSQ